MTDLSDLRLARLLGLSTVKGVGDATLRKLLPYTGPEAHPEMLLDAINRSTRFPIKMRALLAEALRREEWDAHEAIGWRMLEAARRCDIQVILFDDPHYPPYLQLITDPPTVLYARGLLINDMRTVACVGTREPSAFGRRAAQQITAYLAREGWTIVSGLAKGIDSISHETALASGARTVAILANGLDTVYPAVNRDLAAAIVEQGGLLLSEQPVGASPSPRNLVARDRLQSGMSVATIVFETSVDGGTMHTANFARRQERFLACPVPPANYAELTSCGGVKLLLKQGAYPIPDKTAYPALLTVMGGAAGTSHIASRSAALRGCLLARSCAKNAAHLRTIVAAFLEIAGSTYSGDHDRAVKADVLLAHGHFW